MPPYDTSVEPAAAYLTVQVTNPNTGATTSLPAKLDTGAAISVLPQTTVVALTLDPTGDIWAAGYDGKLTLLPTYIVTFKAEGYAFADVEVTVAPRKDALLGRDVLNHFILTLNGKNLNFELQDP